MGVSNTLGRPHVGTVFDGRDKVGPLIDVAYTLES